MATTRDPRVRVAPAYTGQKRQQRRPQHRFNLVFRPYQIQPFAIAPVLPGETLKNLLMQARVLTDPLSPTMKLTGWWCEQYYFYVKHRDLYDDGTATSPRALVTQMVLNPATDMSSMQVGAAVPWTYAYKGSIDWVFQCTSRIVEEYFRDPGESYNSYALDGVPQAAIYGMGLQDALEKLTMNANKRTDESSFDLISPDGHLHPRDMDERWQHWMALRDAGLMQMDYNDFIKTYGAHTREDEVSPNLHRPEMLRYERQWQYPTNIVAAATGVPSVAVAWSLQDREDKDFRFNEPGFVIGLMCCRPKVFLGHQDGAMVGAMINGAGWLPALTNDNYELAYLDFVKTAGPLQTVMSTSGDTGYWVDLRDLFLNGDQFLNYSPSGVVGMPALPDNTGQRRYAVTADIDAMFNAASPLNKIRADGVLHLTIAGMQRKTQHGTGL